MKNGEPGDLAAILGRMFGQQSAQSFSLFAIVIQVLIDAGLTSPGEIADKLDGQAEAHEAAGMNVDVMRKWASLYRTDVAPHLRVVE